MHQNMSKLNLVFMLFSYCWWARPYLTSTKHCNQYLSKQVADILPEFVSINHSLSTLVQSSPDPKNVPCINITVTKFFHSHTRISFSYLSYHSTLSPMFISLGTKLQLMPRLQWPWMQNLQSVLFLKVGFSPFALQYILFLSLCWFLNMRYVICLMGSVFVPMACFRKLQSCTWLKTVGQHS